MFIQIVSLLLIALGTIIILIDNIPIFTDWLGRIHIGRYADKKKWGQYIIKKGISWLNKTPKIKVTDNTRLVFIDILKGNYTKSAIQHWQEAALILGLAEYLKYKDNKDVKREILRFLNNKLDNNGQWKQKPKHIDVAILAYSIMKLDFIDEVKYKEALDFTWILIKEHMGTEGTIGYRKSMQSYRYVDTIGFICPFLVAYGTRYNKKECIDLAVKQIKEYVQYGMLNNQFIPCHAYKVENKIPLGLYGWGRGLGWFAIGLIDTWTELPVNSEHRNELEKIVVNYAKTITTFQQENGSWNWTVGRNECRADSSTTATLGWYMLNASRIPEISNECLASTEKAIKYLMKVTRRNGVVDFSQGDTKDIGVYSVSFNILPFTQGFCIRTINLYENQKLVKCNADKAGNF